MTALLASGCAASNVLTLPADGCSTLVPASMKSPVPHAEIGDTGDSALDWQLYATAETGVVNVLNNNVVAGFSIIEGCEARDRAAAERINAPWWQVWR